NNLLFQEHDELVTVECGYELQDFVRSMLVLGYGGMEGIEGIPGTIGGAVYMNAGAYGYNISDYIHSVKCIDSSGEIVYLSKVDCNFEYRNSLFKKNRHMDVLQVKFKLPKIDVQEATKKIEIFHIARHTYQEFAYPTLGSVFSTKRDLYGEILGVNAYEKIRLFLLKVLLKNPIVKRIRKYPTLETFNNLIIKKGLFNTTKQPVSKKTINTLINHFGC